MLAGVLCCRLLFGRYCAAPGGPLVCRGDHHWAAYTTQLFQLARLLHLFLVSQRYLRPAQWFADLKRCSPLCLPDNMYRYCPPYQLLRSRDADRRLQQLRSRSRGSRLS